MKYFTNFEDSDVAADPPLGWTKRWAASASPGAYTRTVENSTPAFKRRQVRLVQGGSSIAAITYDVVDADANRADVEVLALVKLTATPDSDHLVIARGSGASAAVANGYYGNITPSVSEVRIGKVVSGAFTNIAVASFTASAGNSYLMRFRVNGTSLKLRVWLAGAAEPSAWNVETTDSALSAAGWVGFSGFTNARVSEWNFFSVGTKGDSAPSPMLNSEFESALATLTSPLCVLADLVATGYDSGGSPYTKNVNARFSNMAYQSQAQDSPANTAWLPVLTGVPTFDREMGVALRGQTPCGFGKLKIANPKASESGPGVRDDLLRMKWERNYVRVRIGFAGRPLHDFRTFILGRLGQPVSVEDGINAIEFPINDLSGVLANPLQTSLYSAGPFANQPKPILAGRVAYMEPVPTTNSSLELQIHDGSVNDIDDVLGDGATLTGSATIASVNAGTDTITFVQDHGLTVDSRLIFAGFPASAPPTGLSAGVEYFVKTVPATKDVTLSATRGGATIDITGTGTGALATTYLWWEDLSNGKITVTSNVGGGRVMVKNPSRALSGGDDNKPSKVIEYLIFTKYGLSANFKESTSFASLLTDLPVTMGMVFYPERITAIDALNKICEMTNCWWGITPDGLLQVGRFQLPAATAAMSFTANDVKPGSLKLTNVLLPINRSTLQIKVSKNWYNGPRDVVAPNRDPGLVRESGMLTGSSWPAAGTPLDDRPNQAELAEYPLFESAFLEAESPSEASRLETLRLKRLGFFDVTIAHLKPMVLSIGQTISLSHPELGWKQWTSGDPASPDNTATIDSRLAVVTAIRADVPNREVTLTLMRVIPGYYPTADVT